MSYNEIVGKVRYVLLLLRIKPGNYLFMVYNNFACYESYNQAESHANLIINGLGKPPSFIRVKRT